MDDVDLMCMLCGGDVDDVDLMCMLCGGDVDLMCMLCGGDVDDVDPQCGVSTCPHLHIGRILVVPCLPVLFLTDKHNASQNLIVTIARDFRWNFVFRSGVF